MMLTDLRKGRLKMHMLSYSPSEMVRARNSSLKRDLERTLTDTHPITFDLTGVMPSLPDSLPHDMPMTMPFQSVFWEYKPDERLLAILLNKHAPNAKVPDFTIASVGIWSYELSEVREVKGNRVRETILIPFIRAQDIDTGNESMICVGVQMRHLREASTGVATHFSVHIREEWDLQAEALFTAMDGGHYEGDDPVEELRQELRQLLISTVFPVLFGMQLLSCKNVMPVETQSISEKRRRYLQSTGQPVPGRHYTLSVHVPATRAAAKSVTQRGADSTRPLHLVRGHFANYDEKPLFGKHRGRFWVPSHARGIESVGTIVKNYALVK